MKIRAIRIRNLASLAGDTEIDFTKEPLCSAGIFAITGPTGAGKSTLLDAMCLALYARAPRYRMAEHTVAIADVDGSSIKQADVRGILRDGTSGGYAEVDFTGVDDQVYRATWQVRRARNKADGRLQNYEMALKNITSGSRDIPGKKTELLAEIERLVGLNFEQFTRSVLLAQGDFTAFLKAGRDEKSSLLEKLTGTTIYSEISKKIFDHQREEQQKLRELTTRREEIAILTHEELSNLLTQKAAMTAAITDIEAQLSVLNRELNWQEQYQSLQQNIRAAAEEYDRATLSKEAAIPREEQFRQIIGVQPIRPVVNALQDISTQHSDRVAQANRLAAELKTQERRYLQESEALKQAMQVLEQALQEQEAAQPLLDAAKVMDVQLREKKEQIAQLTNELSAVAHKEIQQQEQLRLIRVARTQLESEIEKRRCWKAENEYRRPIAEAEPFIVSSLRDASAILERQQNYAKRMGEAAKKCDDCRQRKVILAERGDQLRQAVAQEQEAYQTLVTAMSATPFEAMKAEYDALMSEIESLISAAAHWRLLYQAIREKERITQSIIQYQQDAQQHSRQMAAAEQKLTIARSEKEGSWKMLEQARTAAAESVSRLRSRLTPGAPCPVCGSTEHPYADNHPALDAVLAGLEAAYAQNETNYNDRLHAHSSLMQSLKECEKSVALLEEQRARNEQSLLTLESQWQDMLLPDGGTAVAPRERDAWFAQQLPWKKQKRQQLQEQLQAHEKQKEASDRQQRHLSELEKQLIQADSERNEVERKLAALQEQQQNDRQEQEQAGHQLKTLAESLSGYFSSAQWFEHWQRSPETFLIQLRRFAREWKNTETELNERREKQTIATEQEKACQEQLYLIGQELAAIEQKHRALQNQIHELENKRKTLFKGAPVVEVETALKHTVASAKEGVDRQRLAVEKTQESQSKNRALYEQLAGEQKELTRQELALKTQLNDWLVQHPQQGDRRYAPDELTWLLAFSQEWIATERIALRAIDDAVTQATSVLKERKKAMEEHSRQQLSERSPETLRALKADAEALLKAHLKQIHELEFKFQEDRKNKERAETLLNEIDRQTAVAERWASLNELIGSADGKKFRQIAQEYTLDWLLGYTNVHLELLSKRYVLQRIPGSLGLQVIDQDMGDEVRTVYSLSGGESFIVALALALGLASLSASKMNVASLFIDEGFGSLDPATLNIAIDALERLHHQGRQVGVISHVQEMTERIPVQIRVHRRQGGQSTVEVVDAWA